MTRMLYNMLVAHSLLAVSALASTTAASALRSSEARLPASLQAVAKQVVQQGGSDGSPTAAVCLLTSRTVTRKDKQALCAKLLDIADSEEDLSRATSLGNAAKGLVLAQPTNVDEIVATTAATGANIVYMPSSVDLARQEGLFVQLAPAMEHILASSSSETASTLWIVVDNASQMASTKAALNTAAAALLPHLVSPHKSVATLDDVFDKVVVCTADELAASVVSSAAATSSSSSSTFAEDMQQRIANAAAVTSSSSLLSSSWSATDVAAARRLGTLLQPIVEDTMATLRIQYQSPTGKPQRMPDFGSLCNAAFQQAMTRWDEKANVGSRGASRSSTAQALRRQLRDDLQTNMADDFVEQLQLLEIAQLDGFSKSLNKLTLSPRLPDEMQKVVSTSSQNFAKAAARLMPSSALAGGLGKMLVQAAQSNFDANISEQSSSRLLKAKASGKFKPVPRKGVTVGLHWLLPKPFGNDYRQEPWMVHAADNLVYTSPNKKVTEVSPSDVAAGADWRNQVVPSPVGADMVYVQ